MYFLRRDLNSEKLFTEVRDDGKEENKRLSEDLENILLQDEGSKLCS